jgi:hypothetical protein
MTTTPQVCYRQRAIEVFEEPLTERFHEQAEASLAEAVLEREGFLVRNVALLGPESRNGYRYTAEAMQEAAPLYDRRPVFVDHGANTPGVNTPGSPQRSIRDYAGKVLNPRYEGERIRGDVRLLGPNAEWLFGLIEASPSDIGMSHVVLARRNRAGDEVEQIEKVVSVDIVAFPATVQSFRETTFSGESQIRGETETPISAERSVDSCKPSDMKRALIAAIRGK